VTALIGERHPTPKLADMFHDPKKKALGTILNYFTAVRLPMQKMNKSSRNVCKLIIVKLCFNWKHTSLISEGLLVICLLLKGEDYSWWTSHGDNFRVLRGPADLRANMEGKNQCSVLEKVSNGNQRDKSVGKNVYCTCGRVWEGVRRNCHAPLPVSPPQPLTPLFMCILQQAHELGLRPAPATAAVLAHWEFTSVFHRLRRDGQGLPHLPAAQDGTQNSTQAALWMLPEQTQSLYPCYQPPAFSLLPCTGTCIIRRCIHIKKSISAAFCQLLGEVMWKFSCRFAL